MTMMATPTTTVNPKPHSAISPTAKFVAHLRALCGIKHADKIAKLCDAEAAYRSIAGANDVSFMAPLIQRRHEAINAALDRVGCLNVLELAAGLSPRGLLMSEQNPDCFYLETDLTDMLAEKARIAASILGNVFSRRHQFRVLNAASHVDFQRAMTGFFPDDEPLAVISEGLLPYLSRDEQARLARSIGGILQQRPGSAWITTDIMTHERAERMMKAEPAIRPMMEAIIGMTGRDLLGNAFPSLDDAQKFFESFGFAVSRYTQAQLVPKLDSIEKLGVDPARIEEMSKEMEVWVIRVPE